MRVSYVATFGLVLALVPFSAQAESGHVFGSYTCSQPVPCEGYSLRSEAWAKLAAECTTKGFGMSIDGLFDDIAGLAADNCVTTNADVIPQGKLTRLIPHCCAVSQEDGNCYMSCQLLQE
ncbi:MAG: hypothetical protein PHW76_06210 [Alphaproteobacteria bacterium]|nr:hypothetical protein [Alphaproteobacteria bacterium]